MGELQRTNEQMNDDLDTGKARDLLELFASCREVAVFLNSLEAEMFRLKILSFDRKPMPEPLIKLELLLYELGSDPHLTDGVFYAISISFKPDGEEKSEYAL